VPADRLQTILLTIGRSSGVPSGIVAGQAWECEPKVDLAHYHRSKTGALFAAAAVAGAAAAGKDAEAWRAYGELLGESYQVADDLRDSAGDEDEIGKPIGQDAALGRPSAVAELGIEGAIHRLHHLVAASIEAMPPCSGAPMLRAMMQSEVKRLVPKKLAQFAA
jgi:geranylgeranyl diphosphate synthase type II